MTTSHFFCVIHHSTFVCFSSGHLFIFNFYFLASHFRAHSGATLFLHNNNVKNKTKCNNKPKKNDNNTEKIIQFTYFIVALEFNETFSILLFLFFFSYFLLLYSTTYIVYVHTYKQDRKKNYTLEEM